MKVFISSFCCLCVLVGACVASPLRYWLYDSGLIPFQRVAAQQVNDMVARPMTPSTLSYEIRQKNIESCEAAVLRHQRLGMPMPEMEHCPPKGI